LAILVSMGVAEPPSWEKAATDGVMGLALATCGGGLLSLDNLIIADMLRALIG
jgi:putative oxidoreductase